MSFEYSLIHGVNDSEENAIELIKYKNIAEALEGATDSAKRVSDSVRKIILRYTE